MLVGYLNTIKLARSTHVGVVDVQVDVAALLVGVVDLALHHPELGEDEVVEVQVLGLAAPAHHPAKLALLQVDRKKTNKKKNIGGMRLQIWREKKCFGKGPHQDLR